MSLIKKVTEGLFLNAKNLRGWKTKRKIVVFSVDDYGNVRVDSKKARENMDKAGLKIHSRFDKYDALENEEDLLMLYETLDSVKDMYGRPAVFTPFAMPANIDFEKIIASNFTEYHYELLPQTLEKLPGYERVYALIREGIEKKLLVPQFHGREHLNLKVLKENLQRKDPVTIAALSNRSYTSIENPHYPTIAFTAAFEFFHFDENYVFDNIIKEGLDAFEKVYGYRSTHFNPPGGREHPYIHKALVENGVQYFDTPFLKTEHQGEGVYKKRLNCTGKKTEMGKTYIVRNCVFEPLDRPEVDWVAYVIKQIEAAFRWGNPANISSHRVNFCGHIDPVVRRRGLDDLKRLLREIVKRWPNVEFMTADELASLVAGHSS